MTNAQPVPHRHRPLVIWRLVDGKPGHENQTLGLTRALADLLDVEVHDIAVRGGWHGWLHLALARCPLGRGLPDPDLLLGAGHATHAALLACRRSRGGRAVVLMKPSLPRGWFDLCVIPEHDGVPASPGVLLTRGVLNPLRPSADKDPRLGLILVGGPSKHYAWDEAALCAQVASLVADDQHQWLLATSRRTPDTTLLALQGIATDNLRIVPSAQTAPGWLQDKLARAALAWITEDSVSMLYEALTAGAACGVLPVPTRSSSRVRAGLQRLLRNGEVCSFDAWRAGRAPRPADQPFDEAARCARWIVDRWFGA